MPGIFVHLFLRDYVPTLGVSLSDGLVCFLHPPSIQLNRLHSTPLIFSLDFLTSDNPDVLFPFSKKNSNRQSSILRRLCIDLWFVVEPSIHQSISYVDQKIKVFWARKFRICKLLTSLKMTWIKQNIFMKHILRRCSETTLTGESRFHTSIPLWLELGPLVTGSIGLTHWTSETVCEYSEIAGFAQWAVFVWSTRYNLLRYI